MSIGGYNMPGFTTHYLFGADAYKRISDRTVRQNLYKNHSAFGLGLQGPDVFFYYLPSYLLHRDNLGAIAHSQRTGLFFTNLLESRTMFTGHKRLLAIADAYLIGFLGHYTLDCTAHPYIYALTRYTPANPPKEINYFGQHAYLETELDGTLLQLKKHKQPSRFHQNATIHLNALQKSVIARMLTYAYRNTYPDLIIHEWMMYGAFFWMSTGTRLIRDPYGQKKVVARFIERIFIGHAFLSPMIPSDHHHFVADPMNLSHKTWTHPWTKEISNSSFPDLYAQAGQLYDRRICRYQKMINRGFTREDRRRFCHEYGNRSFLSGLSLVN